MIMSSVPKSPFDVARASRSALTPIEFEVFARCEEAASQGLPAPSIEELTTAIGVNGAATVPGIMKRLEGKGYITRKIFQRGRQVCITATGQCTVPPSNQSPHWRLRTDPVPAPAIQSIRERSQPLAAMIEAAARKLGKQPNAFLCDLVYIGWHQYDQEQGE